MSRMVQIDDTGIPDGIIRIADQLPAGDELAPGETVTLRFTHAFLYMTGLVLLAAWRKALPAHVRVAVDDSSALPEAQRFLTNTGFREVIETGTYHPSVPSRIGKVPIQAILKGREKEATVNEIVRIFDEYAGQVPDTAPFRVLVSELCENVLAHSELTTPGYICARVLEGNNKCEIAIADTGIGIEQSFRQGTNEVALQRIRDGQSAVSIALEGLSSSKPEPGRGIVRTYFGLGLFITRRLVEENHGRLTLMSGSEAVNVERYSQSRRTLVRPWHGTFVAVVLDLDYPLPLEHVYGEAETKVIPTKAPGAAPPMPVPTQPQPAQPEVFALTLSNYGTQLLTRDLGTAIRADVAGQLAAGRSVKVQLDGIEDITPSCVDEAFGKLSEVMGTEAFAARVFFEGTQPIVKTLIQFVLKTRQRSA
jgi:Histidine kinase-, DNA gyrase B-, and HSP90-like ATPase